jgi:hypothetical protein
MIFLDEEKLDDDDLQRYLSLFPDAIVTRGPRVYASSEN